MKTIYGYWRCSTDAQDQERQIRSLQESGCEKIFGDFITGTSNYGDREELSKLLDEIEDYANYGSVGEIHPPKNKWKSIVHYVMDEYYKKDWKR